MSARALSTRPNLEQYKKQAKELVKAWKTGDAVTLSRIGEQHPRLSASSDADLQRARFTLSDAQFIIAREHGFDSWPKFAAHIESMTGQPQSSEIWKLAERAVAGGDASTLAALLRDHGEILRTAPVQSTWWGGLAPDYSMGDARAVIAREHHFDNWDQFESLAEALKDASSPAAQFEAAVDAIVTGDVVTLERLIHANPNLIRGRSTRTHRSTLLHYVGANGVEGFRQRTPTNAVQIAEILLNAGADVDAKADMYGGGSTTLGLVATSIHPVTAGVQEDLMSFLLARGASVGTAKGIEAWSSLINGCHANGRGKAAEFLAERAPGLDLEAAAGVGRLDVVKTFFTPDAKLRENATGQQMKDGFTWACEYGRTEVVAFLLQKGMDVAAKLRHHGQTGLHWAASGAHPDTVRVLLRWKAPVDAKDDAFDGTPLGWALYAWAGGGPHAGSDRYYQVVNLLVGAGATVDQEWLADSERGLPLATKIREDARMRAALGTGR
jgi:ankyrin repeat protein